MLSLIYPDLHIYVGDRGLLHNLLPFPGLDGWHLLVIAVEGIFRKEIPSKVKNIISFVGVAILFVLMILIVIKDIIGLF